MSGFTPGPWRAEAHTNKPEEGGNTVYSIEGPDDATVVEVGMDRDYYTYEAAIAVEADARLIAAAPDLLDVLSRLADFPFAHQGAAEGPLAYILNQAKAVLAKARGDGA